MTSFSGTLGANNLDNDSTRNHPWPSLAKRNLDLVSSWQHSFLPLNRRLPPPKQQSKLLRAKTADDGRSFLASSLPRSVARSSTQTNFLPRKHHVAAAADVKSVGSSWRERVRGGRVSSFRAWREFHSKLQVANRQWWAHPRLQMPHDL